MKLFVLGIALLLIQSLTTNTVVAGGPAQLPQTQKEKESYSIGYQFGVGMKSDSVDADFQNLLKGLHDAMDGKEPSLEREEMKRLILDLKKRGRELALRRAQEQIVGNAKESERFLDENGKRPGIRTTASGLQYKVLREGSGVRPGPQDRVRVHYRGTFTDGKEFDSSYTKGEPQTIEVDGVIKGWTEALQLMKAGSKLQLFVPPALAYGRSGLEPKIPPNKVLVFEIELLSVEEKETAKNDR